MAVKESGSSKDKRDGDWELQSDCSSRAQSSTGSLSQSSSVSAFLETKEVEEGEFSVVALLQQVTMCRLELIVQPMKIAHDR